jgi:hypothetical protein
MFSHALPAALEMSAAGRWFAQRLALSNIGVREDEQLEEPEHAADRQTRTIWVPPNMTFPEVHYRACRGVLYIEGGAAWAPEFSWHVAPLAKVLPFRRFIAGSSAPFPAERSEYLARLGTVPR